MRSHEEVQVASRSPGKKRPTCMKERLWQPHSEPAATSSLPCPSWQGCTLVARLWQRVPWKICGKISGPFFSGLHCFLFPPVPHYSLFKIIRCSPAFKIIIFRLRSTSCRDIEFLVGTEGNISFYK